MRQTGEGIRKADRPSDQRASRLNKNSKAMRVIVTGGSGHIGTYLTPRLVEEGHHVVCVSRSKREPYFPHTAWREVELHTIVRAADNFGSVIRGLKPDVVIDLICYTLESAQHLVR